MFRYTDLIIFRVTRDCNLKCQYCFMTNKDAFKGEMVSFEDFKKIVDRIVYRRISQGLQSVPLTFVFHGGEPLMLGEKKFRQFLEYLTQRMDENDCAVQLSIQSNATLMTEEYAKLFHEFNVCVGMSFDGINGANKSRTDLKQKTFEKKFKLLKKNKTNFSFIIVAGKHNIDQIDETKKYIEDITHSFKVNFAEDMHNLDPATNIELTGKEFFEKVYKPDIDSFIKTGQMIDRQLLVFLNRAIISMTSEIEPNEITGCGKLFCGSCMRMIGVNPDGSAHYCDRYNQEYDETYVMNVLDYDFLGLHQLKRAMDFNRMRHDIVLDAGCDFCRAKYVCDGGCAAFYRSKHGKNGIDKSITCTIFLPLYDYIESRFIDIVTAYSKFNNIIVTGDKIIGRKEDAIKRLKDVGIEVLYSTNQADCMIGFKREDKDGK